MNVKIIRSGKGLTEEILLHLEAEERDYSSSAVVFPGRRPSHFLRKALARKVGSSHIPPACFSMDEFIDSLYEGLHQDRKLETIDAVAILYDIHRSAPSPIGGKGFLTPESFFPLGMKIYRDIEELFIEGVNPQFVKEIEPLKEGVPEQTFRRLQSLSLFYEEFYGEAKAKGFSTRSQRYRIVSEKIGEAGTDRYKKLIFCGFFALTFAEKDLFRNLMSHYNTLFIFQKGPGLEEKLLELGISPEVLSQEDENELPGPEVRFYSSPDTHGQVLALTGVLEAGSRVRDEGTVIVLPSSGTLFPLLRHGLTSSAVEDFNISMGYPLIRTPVFGFLNNLMELINSMDGERVYVPDYLKFVLHPYTKNIYFMGKAETTRVLFHAIEEGLLGHRTKTFVTLEELEKVEVLSAEVLARFRTEEEVTGEALRQHLIGIHNNTVRKLSSLKHLGDFASKCSDILIYIFNNSTAALHPLFYPFSESFLKALDLFSGSLMKETIFSKQENYFSFFRKYIASCSTPFEGTPVKGVQVLGFLETRNLGFDRVFVMDTNEEVLPDTRKDDTLLPFKTRQALGLPTYIDRDRLSAYYFDTLISSAREVHLFFIEDDRLERSRFAEKLLWKRQQEDRTTSSRPYISTVQYRVNLINREPDHIEKSSEVAESLSRFAFSATSLNQYLSCPLQFYYARVLRINRKEEITGDIDRADLGTFIHNVLKAYFSPKKGRPLTARDIDITEMDLLVERLFRKAYGKDISGPVYLMKRQVRRHMSDLLKDYYIPLVREKTVTVLECEEPISIRPGTFSLKGRPDIVEQRDDKTVIIDYKTGSNRNYLKIDPDKIVPEDRETWGRAIGSLQLPFYLLLYSEGRGRKIKDLDALFLMLGSSKVNRKIELPLSDSRSVSDIPGTFELLRKVIFSLIGEITDPHTPFIPATEKKKTCPPCAFKYLCGTQWVVK